MELEAGWHGTVYQVSYLEEDVGKIVKNSKVKVTWDFVSSNGGPGHKVTLTWSKSTGKQEIRMDGEEIWFGRNKGRSVLDHSWMTRDGHLKLHCLATCAPKINKSFRNYDLLINGQLFASLPHFQQEGVQVPTPLPIRHDNLNSIIQILFPKGYIPPADREELQVQQRQERISLQQAQDVVSVPCQGAFHRITTAWQSLFGGDDNIHLSNDDIVVDMFDTQTGQKSRLEVNDCINDKTSNNFASPQSVPIAVLREDSNSTISLSSTNYVSHQPMVNLLT